MYDERTGRAAALLGAISHFIITMSAEYMNHATSLVCAVLCLLFWFRHARGGRWHQALLAGVFLGLLSDVRPFTALVLAFPLAGCMLWRDISYAIFSKQAVLGDYLPALCCWLREDPRLHLSLFDLLDRMESLQMEDVRFTLLYVSPDSSAAIYDIRHAP